MTGVFYNVSNSRLLKQKIYGQQFVTLFTRIMSMISEKMHNNNNKDIYKINFKDSLMISIDYILYHLMYETIDYEKIENGKYVRHTMYLKTNWYAKYK